MKHLHKCGEHLLRLDGILSVGDFKRGWNPSPGFYDRFDAIPPHFIIHIGNEFGATELKINFVNENDRSDLVKAWEEYLNLKDEK